MQTTDGAFQGRLATLTAILLTTGLLLAASSMHAELLFSDSFDYQSGSLGGKGPPPGSPPGQGGWVIINQNPRVAPSGLDFPEIGTPVSVPAHYAVQVGAYRDRAAAERV